MEAVGFAGMPAEVAGPSQIVLASLPGAADVETVVLGGKGALEGIKEGGATGPLGLARRMEPAPRQSGCRQAADSSKWGTLA